MLEAEQVLSISPDGETFRLPSETGYENEWLRLKTLVQKKRQNGQEIVVEMDVGFVGAAMAGVVADSSDDQGDPTSFVIAVQRPIQGRIGKFPTRIRANRR